MLCQFQTLVFVWNTSHHSGYISEWILFALSLFANKTTHNRMLFITECIRRRHHNKTNSFYSDWNSLQNVYFRFFCNWKITEFMPTCLMGAVFLRHSVVHQSTTKLSDLKSNTYTLSICLTGLLLHGYGTQCCASSFLYNRTSANQAMEHHKLWPTTPCKKDD